ncbi:hypothetical protein PFLUV_G00072450 [Perca fluviatilis]|uniref:Mitochondrial ribosomal protein S36 n=1 Tax=Perca fluviatilis TaxID=8168 RepID=A0A6A5FHA9_PERFL|nr:hypothetical protein PFLUV_G00072450 [Perca fluviatilis]
MGSKVSSKMAAPAARVIQAVRPHAPLIKFPKRQDVARPNVQEALKTLALLPARYRRRPMAVDEMDYIQRGGPE